MGFFDNIGEKFDNIGEKISKTSKEAVSKTKELAEIAKLNMAIKEEEKKISAAHEKLGREYAAKFAESEDRLLPEVFDEISASKNEIAKLGERIRELKGMVVCSECGAEVEGEVKYCPKCGAPVELSREITAQPAVMDAPSCPKCGAPTEPDQDFCVICGERLEK